MALEHALATLLERLKPMYAAMEDFRMTAVEDVPPLGDSALADRMQDFAEDLLGGTGEVIAMVHAQIGMMRGTEWQLAQALRVLSLAHERVLATQNRLFDLLSYDRVAALRALGKTGRPGVASWSRHMQEAMERSLEPLDEVQRALLACWQELVHAAEKGLISVRTTAVGIQTAPFGGAGGHPGRPMEWEQVFRTDA